VPAAADPDLAALAAAHGVAASYEDWRGDPIEVPAPTLRAVLAAMGVEAGDAAAVRAALQATERERRLVPPAVVTADAALPVVLDRPAEVTLTAADGSVTDLSAADGMVRLPEGLPLGAHRLTVRDGAREDTAHLLVVPPRCPVPGNLRAWGWQVQLYALRSHASWGIGDLGDLRALAGLSGRAHGTDLVLLNPLHAVLPVLPQEHSPYYPASRRFTNPLYLRVEHCDGYDALRAGERRRVDELAAASQAGNRRDSIDRDGVLQRKMEAFALLASQPLPPGRQTAFAAYRDAEGHGLLDFATAAALAERHGRSFRSWPAELHDPRSRAVAAARAELADRVALHEWLQWQCDEQLAAAAAEAADAGMAVGLVTDLAVGVDPGGADAWALQADLAQGVTVGAPPDAFNQVGQDWRLPPLRPDRLAATGFASFRDLVRSQLRHARGLRIDHVLGLFRLYWIPDGMPASAGTYVRYPGEDLLGALALEATRAGAVVVGEDLGTVERGTRDKLRAHGVLGTRVLWFERDQPAAELELASVTTHDLPTAAGFLADEPTRVRAALGQLRGTEEAEREHADAERAALLALLVEEGLLDPADSADPGAVVLAMHAFVGRMPCLLVTAALGDAVGDLRQPNLPGTVDEYPNWRLPVAVPVGPRGEELLPPSRPLLLEELLASPAVGRLATVMGNARKHAHT